MGSVASFDGSASTLRCSLARLKVTCISNTDSKGKASDSEDNDGEGNESESGLFNADDNERGNDASGFDEDGENLL